MDENENAQTRMPQSKQKRLLPSSPAPARPRHRPPLTQISNRNTSSAETEIHKRHHSSEDHSLQPDSFENSSAAVSSSPLRFDRPLSMDHETLEKLCDMQDDCDPPRRRQVAKVVEVPDLDSKKINKNIKLSSFPELLLVKSTMSKDNTGQPTRQLFFLSPDQKFIYIFEMHIEPSKFVGNGCNGLHLTYKGALERIDEECLDGNDDKILWSGVETDDDDVFPGGFRVPLGKYGPLLQSDRKTRLAADFKDFLLDGLPGIYAFTVDNDGQEEAIDATDNVTGCPLANYQDGMLMYVNEIGHDITLKQNVFIEQVKAEEKLVEPGKEKAVEPRKEKRSKPGKEKQQDSVVEYSYMTVQFIFLLPTGKHMHEGETIELFTNYSTGYEPYRMLHGYSREHLYEDFVSTPASILTQKLTVRKRVVDSVEALVNTESTEADLVELRDAMEAVYLTTFVPIRAALIKFLREHSGGDVQSVSPVQIQAFQRSLWLVRFVGDALKKIRTKIDATHFKTIESVVRDFEQWLGLMTCHQGVYEMVWGGDELVGHAEGSLVTQAKAFCEEALFKEAYVEVSFLLEKTILKPHDTSMWCPIAMSLCERLTKLVAKILWPVAHKSIDEQCSARKMFKYMLYEEAGRAAKDVHDAFLQADGKTLNDLEFTSGISQDYKIVGPFSVLVQTTTMSKGGWSEFYLGNNITPKGLRANMAKQLTNWKSTCTLNDGTRLTPSDDVLKKDDRFLMVVSEHGPKSFCKLGSVPMSTFDFRKMKGELNVTWYLVWQVAYVIDCFALGFLKFEQDGKLRMDFSIKTLCAKLGIDICLLDFAHDRGMSKEVDFGFEQLCQPAKPVKYKKSLQGLGSSKMR